MEQLSGVAIIICIALGFTTFVLMFIFGKRQIMRFALKSRRGPHIPIAADAPKCLRREIDRRLEIVKEIKFEPKLIDNGDDTAERDAEGKIFDHVYRMKSVDALIELEQAILEASSDVQPRPPGQDLKFYLQRMARDKFPLAGCEFGLIYDFVDLYNHARHEPSPVYTESDHKRYMELLNSLIGHVRQRAAPPAKVESDSKSMQKSKPTSVAALNGRTTVRIVTPSEEDVDDESSV